MTKEELWETWDELKKILIENKIPYSLSPLTARTIAKNEKINCENFRISIWFKDFFILKYLNNLSFLTNEETNEKDLSPFFKFKNRRIYFDLIVGTTKEKCNKLYNFKFHNRLLFWGKNNTNLSAKIFAKRSKILTLDELINYLNEERFLRIIVLGSNHEDFRFFSDLNWKTVEYVKINDYNFPIFKQFLKINKD
ncbi:hypothetical protein NPA07_01375 [Mycoplasmopsis caviae]|uniref:Uncharacterized protein n=1 Tax=Mycoplasmopsis caviae TaxID=55603 RepID=A0A3P8KWF1_9BACT|nr:hypothetical protein [Mycoplasmopsis caviae]UUD35507.1 hypothetical protein NPA07_01375 [Mycoplasmopsis caviae]VDR41717.1 Uncharacterised protein [Mycoplasmopsis caviae]